MIHMKMNTVLLCFFVTSLCLAVVHSASLAADLKSPSNPESDLPSDVETLDLKMKNAIPEHDDAYLCASYDMPDEEVYIVKYEALADASTAHHILLFGCSDGPATSAPTWGCPPLCKGNDQIMFAWAKNAPPTVLPKDVGFRVGGGSSIKSIVLQIHYAHSSTKPDDSGIRIYMTRQKQKYVAGIFLMMSYSITIPPNTGVVHADISCEYDGSTSMFPFAYRTHAHDLGEVITGYQYNNTYHMIGKGNPQWPQAFYPTEQSFEVKPGDKLVARCTFNSTGRSRYTYIGPTSKDEMCNFYMMFYTDSSIQRTFKDCGGSAFPALVKGLPADSDKPLPPNPILDEKAGHHHHHPRPQALPTTSSPDVNQITDLKFDSQWPSKAEVKIGQVSGLATDDDGNIYVFHRGSRIWNQNSFDIFNTFQFPNEPITENAILIFSKDGELIRSFGSEQFFMPHGLAVDHDKNIWVTDVGLHQVLRFAADQDKPNLVLGERFVPESDDEHFCKPTDVAVLSNGDFFVSDGYCNGRIMKYSSNGTLLKQFGHRDILASEKQSPGVFDIPHSLAVAEDKGLVCVADRENGRIQCFDLEGTFRHQIKHPEFGEKLFAVEYSPIHDGIIFAVNGPSFSNELQIVQGFTMDLESGKLLQVWNNKRGFTSPHDLAVNSLDHSVYVGELENKLWKFVMTHGDSLIPTPEKKETIPLQTDENSASDEMNEKSQTTASSATPSIVLGVLLVVPVVLVIIITILVRMYHSGKCGRNKGNKVFNLQSFFNSHKGFDRLSTEESDHEIDPFDGSDEEEYTAPRKQRS